MTTVRAYHERHPREVHRRYTDYDYCRLHAPKRRVEGLNFCRPSPTASSEALDYGGTSLLNSTRNFIMAGGYHTEFMQVPAILALGASGDKTR